MVLCRRPVIPAGDVMDAISDGAIRDCRAEVEGHRHWGGKTTLGGDICIRVFLKAIRQHDGTIRTRSIKE
jgi:hypothetical protein